MDSTASPDPAPVVPIPVKIIIAGGFGVGKTTAVGAISEIPVLSTEAAITEVAAAIDRTGHTPAKTQTTVALDFGRITIDEEIKLYLFGTPGQDRFGFMWRDLIEGAFGALVIVDTRRLDDCYPAVDYFEKIGLPFVVAVNLFDGQLDHGLDDVRWALAISEGVPVVTFDARVRRSVRDALVVLLRRALEALVPTQPAPLASTPEASNMAPRPEASNMASTPEASNMASTPEASNMAQTPEAAAG